MADSVRPRMRDQVICQVIEPATASAWPTAASTAMVSPFPPARGPDGHGPGSHPGLALYPDGVFSSAPGAGLIRAWRRPHYCLASASSAPGAALISAWTRASSAHGPGPQQHMDPGLISASRGRGPPTREGGEPLALG